MSVERLAEIEEKLAGRDSLQQIFQWLKPETVVEAIFQDEFTHDIVVVWQDLYLVFDTT